MTGPLVVLALGVVGAGLVLQSTLDGPFSRWAESVLGAPPEGVYGLPLSALAIVATLLVALTLVGTWLVYGSGRIDWMALRVRMAPLQRLFANGWYVDEYYSTILVTPGKAVAAFTAYRLDARFIDGIVNGIGAGTRAAGRGRAQDPDGLRAHLCPGAVRRRGGHPHLHGVPDVSAHLLSIMLLLPLAGLGLLLLSGRTTPDSVARWIALAASLATFIASLYVLGRFNASVTGFQMVEQFSLGSVHVHLSYLVGVDGISLWMVMLTTFLFPVAVLASWKIDKDVRVYLGAAPARRRPCSARSSPSTSCSSSCSSRRCSSRCTS